MDGPASFVIECMDAACFERHIMITRDGADTAVRGNTGPMEVGACGPGSDCRVTVAGLSGRPAKGGFSVNPTRVVAVVASL